jgi:hypothetical protein
MEKASETRFALKTGIVWVYIPGDFKITGVIGDIADAPGEHDTSNTRIQSDRVHIIGNLMAIGS